MDWFETEGILKFDPRRPGMKRRVQWWCVIELDIGIADYYRWFLDRLWWEADHSVVKRTYHRPAWGAHVSLIRGEKPNRNHHLWGKGSGTRIRLRYNNCIRQTQNALQSGEVDRFWFIDVEWDNYHKFREQFGLSTHFRGKPHRLHMTIARTYE